MLSLDLHSKAPLHGSQESTKIYTIKEQHFKHNTTYQKRKTSQIEHS